MVLDDCLDDAQHHHVLCQVLRPIDSRFYELCTLIRHKSEECCKLIRFAEAVLDEVLVDGDALHDVDYALDVEPVRERVGRDACVLAWRQGQVNLLDCDMLLHELD